MNNILIVDDDDSVRYSFSKLFREPKFRVKGAKNSKEALHLVQHHSFNLIVLDIEMPGISGLEVLKQLKTIVPKTPVLMITAYGSTERVISTMKFGAYDYLEKPFDIPKMKEIVEEALKTGRMSKEESPVPASQKDTITDNFMIGKSLALKEVFKMIGKVAATDVNILITGESGTGKELIARTIHNYSDRSEKPFFVVNCAAIPDTLLESELFGYEKGAFTGALKRKLGKFELANDGTLFLDEIGDMSLPLQAKFLRVIQEGTFDRLGGSETLFSNARIIASTNKNLEKAISRNEFREDLYYRLKVITITLPPLRLRKDDIPELVNFFLTKHKNLLKKHTITLASEAVQKLIDYNWPGNVRQLENVIKQAILLSKSDIITAESLVKELQNGSRVSDMESFIQIRDFIPDNLELYQGRLYEHVMELIEKELFSTILNELNGNQVKTAKLLGISRVMLLDRMKKYGIKPKKLFDKK